MLSVGQPRGLLEHSRIPPPLQSPILMQLCTPLVAFRSAFNDWMENVGKYGPLGKRAAVAWQKIEDVLAQDHPCILASLRCAALGCQCQRLTHQGGLYGPDGKHFCLQAALISVYLAQAQPCCISLAESSFDENFA